jgi:hypothetical protein
MPMNKYLTEALLGLFFAVCLVLIVSNFDLATPFVYQGF